MWYVSSFSFSPAFHPTLSAPSALQHSNSQIFQLCDGIPLHLIEDNEVWSEHVSKMKTNKVYGTLSCLYAASECFSATIHVLCSQGDDIHIFPQSSPVRNFYFFIFF
jgi:hypothetical protein